MSRPVQAVITVPVETALGLSNEPAWLDGYGWLDAPSARVLLPDAELRRVCVDGPTGQVLDLASRDVRPPPSPAGVRQALLEMTAGPVEVCDVGWRTELDHDPSEVLREFVTVRDRVCDGPTQPRSRATTCDLDHDRPHPAGPTAAWNLVSRSRRTHQLKHAGWTPVRTATTTVWTSPAGQVITVPHPRHPAPGTDPDHTDRTSRDRTSRTGRPAVLPDPDELAAVDTDQLTPTTDHRPLITPTTRPATQVEPTPVDQDTPPW